MRWARVLLVVVAFIVSVSVLNSIFYQPDLQPVVGGIGNERNGVVHLPAIYPQPPSVAIKGGLETAGTLDESRGGALCEDAHATKDIQARIDGIVLCPGAEKYSITTMIFNSRLKVSPAIIIQPWNTNDIVEALRIATTHGLNVTVKDGGHNPAGFSLNQGGMVIDMRYMKDVSPDEDTANTEHLLRAQGGSTWADTHPVLLGMGRSIVGGGCPQVGVVGLALGGGVGWTSRHRGLVSDSMVEATIVFPNGTVSTLTEERDKDLLWAMRGAGGSNFGVVSQVKLKTYPIEERYFAGSFCFARPSSSFRDLLEVFKEFVKGDMDEDERLTMDIFMSRYPQSMRKNDTKDEIHLCWAGFFDGPIADAVPAAKPLLEKIAELVDEHFACILKLGECDSPAQKQSTLKKARDWVASGGPWLQNHSFITWARTYGTKFLDVFWKSGMTKELTDDIIDRTVRYFRDLPKVENRYDFQMTVQIALEHLGGAMSRSNSRSAWKHTNSKIMMSVQSYNSNPYTSKLRDTQAHRDVLQYLGNWTDSYYNELLPNFEGAYGNYAHGDLENWADMYYGRENYGRLVEIKSGIDGSHVFQTHQRIQQKGLGDVGGGLQIAESRRNTESAVVDTDSVNGVGSGDALGHMGDAVNVDVDVGGTEGGGESMDKKYVVVDDSLLYVGSRKVIRPESKECPLWLLKSAVPITAQEVKVENGTEGDMSVMRLLQSNKDIDVENKGKSLQGKRCLVTGGSSGFGWSMSLLLAKFGAHVTYSSRSVDGCEQSVGKMRAVLEKINAPGGVSCRPLRLDSFDSVRAFTTDMHENQPIDVVVMNAGYAGKFRNCPEAGNASCSLAVNYLGHFLLMMDMVKGNLINKESGRVIIQSSYAAQRATQAGLREYLRIPGVPYADPKPDEHILQTDLFKAYVNGKALCTVFGVEMANRFHAASTNISVSIAVPPGTAQTELIVDLVKNDQWKNEVLMGHDMMPNYEGALSAVFLATHPSPQDLSDPGWGVSIVGGCKKLSLPTFAPYSGSRQFRCDIWKSSLQAVGLGDGSDLVC